MKLGKYDTPVTLWIKRDAFTTNASRGLAGEMNKRDACVANRAFPRVRACANECLRKARHDATRVTHTENLHTRPTTPPSLPNHRSTP